MDDLYKLLLCRRDELCVMKKDISISLRKMPKGSLRISHNQGTVQYYWNADDNSPHGTYIRKCNIEIIHQLAQKNYYQHMLPVIETELKRVEKMLKGFDPMAIENVYESLDVNRKSIVDPYILTDDKYVEKWLEEKRKFKAKYYDNGNMYPIEGDIITENGDHVRSKSEKIIADKLLLMKIPYVYECPMKTKDSGLLWPDFTVLNVRLRKSFIHEHFGMMGDAEYSEKAARKIEIYEKGNLFLGRDLVVTMESSLYPLNTSLLEAKFRMFYL